MIARIRSCSIRITTTAWVKQEVVAQPTVGIERGSGPSGATLCFSDLLFHPFVSGYSRSAIRFCDTRGIFFLGRVNPSLDKQVPDCVKK